MTYKGLNLLKTLSHARSYFGTGLYAGEGNKKYVVKFWSGKYPDVCYYLLLREITLLEYLKKNMRPGKVSFPEFVASFSSSNELVLITNFFPSHANGKYTQAIEFLHSLPMGLPIPVKSAWYFILLFPVIWTISVFRHWSLLPLLVQSWAIFWLNSSFLFRSYEPVFVHGDLHPDNLLTDGQKILILDPGQAIYTYPELEIASTIACPNINDKFKQSLIPAQNKQVFSAVGIYCAICNLTRAASPVYINSLVNLLNLCLK